MNKNCKFHSLTPDERQQILRWCEETTYDEVVIRVGKPRPEGFALETSISAVQRFYTTYSPLCYDGDVLHQCASAYKDHNRLKDPENFSGAIISILEQRIFSALLHKRMATEIMPDLRILTTFQRLRTQSRKERAKELLADRMHPPFDPFDDEAEDEPTQAAPTPAPVHKPSPKPAAKNEAPPSTPAKTHVDIPGSPVKITLPDVLSSLTGEQPYRSAYADLPPGLSRENPAKPPGNPAFPGIPAGQKKPNQPPFPIAR